VTIHQYRLYRFTRCRAQERGCRRLVSGGSGYDTQNRPPHPVWGPAQTARGWAGRNRLFSAREPPPTEAFARTIQCTRKALSRQSDSPILGWPSPALPCIACDSDASRDVPQSSILHGQIAHKKLSSSLHGHRADRGCPRRRPRPRPSTGTEPTEAVIVPPRGPHSALACSSPPRETLFPRGLRGQPALRLCLLSSHSSIGS